MSIRNEKNSVMIEGEKQGGRWLLPVITLVIYWSLEQWDSLMSIHDMLSVKDENILSLV
ncbi:MAG: hypothetical protein ACI4F9_00310 [Lachnospiraceae bacterium]